MTNYEIYSLFIDGFIALIALGGFVYAGIQLKKTTEQTEQLRAAYEINEADHDWNRRIASQDALKEYNQSTISSGLQLQSEFNYLSHTESIPLEKIEERFNNHPNLQLKLHQLLNFYEGLARGIFHNVYDEKIIKAARYNAMKKAFRAFNSYIESRRKNLSPDAWSDLELLINQWKADEKNKIKEAQHMQDCRKS